MFDLDDEETAIVLGLLALGFVAFNAWRSSQATDQGGAVFSATAPPSNTLESVMTIIDPMQLSAAGEAFIKKEEGLTLTKKGDGAKQEIGWGHDILPGENIPNKITVAFAQQLFDGDSAIAAAAVNNSVTAQLSQNQFDACCSLAYRAGAGAFKGSTLVRLLNQNPPNYAGAAAQFQQWNNHGSEQGRANREGQLFNGNGN